MSAVLVVAFAEEEMYSSKYDDIDIEEILANTKLREQYLKCYLETGPCVTADAKYFKDRFPEAFVTKCKKCTPKQVIFFDKISEWFTENEPEMWKAVIEKAVQNVQNKGGER
ncbi:Ejaculatory bulb-specific protein 3 [Dufourea novaeangliae]|uniref:Ejaculatory bulb-specific protein 3 n=2 Tax=Dufourea novaeangliae TaxID=178035 RepID=A0A154PIH1_DUFNO|nr:Ejaculatory bulb-specific protein 3 [Dufourea novaeangliae]